MRSLAILSLALGAAKAAVTLTSDGCVDASGFEQCHTSATNEFTSCMKDANADGSQEEILACGCAEYENNFNCYSTSCWNRVWECEYQSYVIEYLDTCPIAKTPVPYFPIPDNAEDACSCNIGKVYESLYPPITDATACMKNIASSDFNKEAQMLQGCQCCEVSAMLSNIYGTCPEVDPSLLFIDAVTAVEKAYGIDFSECGPSLAQFNCVKDLGFTDVAGGTFFSPDNLPKNGTQSYSNGPGTVTAPASGSVFTYTNPADNEVFTITAASAGKGNSAKTTAAASNKATGSNSDSDGGSPTATGSGSSSTSGTGKSDGELIRVSKSLFATILVLSSSLILL